MKLFLWRQKNHRIESSVLLQWSIDEYVASKQNTEEDWESNLDSLFEFVKDPKGKPVVVDAEGEAAPMHVSVTHTGDWWICAVGEYPVGIDAELKSRRVDPRLVRRICTEEELQWLEQGMAVVPDDQRDEWLRQKLIWLWVRKEAYVKYLGTGIGEGLKSFSVVQAGAEETFRENEGYRSVELSGIPEAETELELVVYSPRDEIEEIRWRKW